MIEWPDIPGVTAVDGRPRLPRDPRVAIKVFALALDGVHEGTLSLPDLVARSLEASRTDRARVEGLAGWLPLSHVAAWDGFGGGLTFDPATDLTDMAIRYAVWVSTQPVPETWADQSRAYSRAIVDEAGNATQRAELRTTPPAQRAREESAGGSGPSTRATPVAPAVAERVRALLAGLDQSFLERRQHIRGSLLALLAGQHVLLLGPPGTAKSMLARALCQCFEDATYFEYLLSRFTHPDELFGPVSIPGLKEEDYRRLTTGFLPQAQVGFLDEIFKANSAILNSLLTLINERVFHHGRHRDPVPLIGLIGASNELPDPEGGLGALYDRFLVRLTVPPLAGPEAFLTVATSTVPAPDIDPANRLSPADLDLLRVASEQVVVPTEIRDALVNLWRTAQEHEWACSDRRWRQAVRMMKVGAAADGRTELIPLDLLLLEPVLAPEPERAFEVREALLEQLGVRSVPSHDLRAQWTLLGMDRVAPTAELPLGTIPHASAGWRQRLGVRRENLDRFLAHHSTSVDRLALDRAGIEDLATAHTWIARLPSQVLAAHIEAARELAAILKLGEAYRTALTDTAACAGALVLSLPEVARRIYGHGAVCVLSITGSPISVGLTTAGEREQLPSRSGGLQSQDGLVRPTDDPLYEIPLLELKPEELLDLVEGKLEPAAVLQRVRATASPNVKQALMGMRRYLGGSAVPLPPPLPAP